MRLTGSNVTDNIGEDANATSLATNEMICARVSHRATKRRASGWGDEARDEGAIGTIARDDGRHVTLIASLSMGLWERFYRDIVGGGGIAVAPLPQRQANPFANPLCQIMRACGEKSCCWCSYCFLCFSCRHGQSLNRYRHFCCRVCCPRHCVACLCATCAGSLALRARWAFHPCWLFLMPTERGLGTGCVEQF